MKKIAVFPGSFDPITRGHVSIVHRALPLFDEIIIAAGINPEKKYLFPIDKRIVWLKQVFANDKNIRVDKYDGLTVDFCRANNAKFLLRGLRATTDFEFERSIAQMNKQIYTDIETVFFLSLSEFIAINSSIVRNIYLNGGDITQFVPEGIKLNE
jgi:pantetheine-phosphate adenylyltransferase